MKIVSNGKTLEVVGGGESGGDVYSTEEQVVGTWIDGKPLYRRVLEAIIPSITTDWQTIYSFTDDVAGVMFNSWSISQTDGAIEPLPTTAGNNVPTKTVFTPGVGMRIYNQGPWYVGRLCRAVLYYTKTTDQATIELPAALTAKKTPITGISAAEMLGDEMKYSVAATMALGDELGNEEV